MGRHPAFFAAHQLTRWEMVAFAVVLVVAPPLVLVLIEALVGLAAPVARRTVHLVFVGGLAALFALQLVPLADSAPAQLMLALAALLGVLAALLYRRVHGLRLVLSALGPAPLVFLLLFVLASPASSLVTGGTAQAFNPETSFRPPIVFFVFDGFPGTSIQTVDGKIDAVRYPHLAALAGDAAWYPNASNVHDSTVASVPSIATGKLPQPGLQPILADHPHNLFTLLGTTYQVDIRESATNLCPAGLCRNTSARGLRDRVRRMAGDVWAVYGHLVLPPGYRQHLPDVTQRWAGFAQGAPVVNIGKTRGDDVLAQVRDARLRGFRRALEAITAPEKRPGLDFAHVMLPHEPSQFLPDGKFYRPGVEPESSLEGPPSHQDEFLTQQAWQRKLLQIGWTDRLVGKVVARLKRLGVYEQSMIVIVSDHGESFDVAPRPARAPAPGELAFRRRATMQNLEDIASVPLFVKYPAGHGPSGPDRRYVRTVDVLPTIADVLGIRLPFEVDGRSLLDRSYEGHDEIVQARGSGPALRMDVRTWNRRRLEVIRRRIALFGQGAGRPGLFGIGPRRDLIGRRVAELSVSAGDTTATFLEPDRFKDVDPAADVSPSHVAGRIAGVRPGQGLVLAVNGEIVASGRSFEALGPRRLNWSMLFPHEVLRRGANRVELFEADGGSLRRIGAAPG